eukprot:02821.XXX_21093_21263_1 [CDS] Oithona nana genome sequencing.
MHFYLKNLAVYSNSSVEIPKIFQNFSLLGTFTTFSSKGIFTVFRSENALKETHFTV